MRRAGRAERDARRQLVDDARREARRVRDDAVRLRAERDFTNIRRAPVEHEAALDVALEERVRRDAARDGAGVVGPRDREPRPRPRAPPCSHRRSVAFRTTAAPWRCSSSASTRDAVAASRCTRMMGK